MSVDNVVAPAPEPTSATDTEVALDKSAFREYLKTFIVFESAGLTEAEIVADEIVIADAVLSVTTGVTAVIVKVTVAVAE